jgi:hypothetical protein
MMKKLVFGMFIVFAFACSNPLVEEKIDIKIDQKATNAVIDEI